MRRRGFMTIFINILSILFLIAAFYFPFMYSKLTIPFKDSKSQFRIYHAPAVTWFSSMEASSPPRRNRVIMTCAGASTQFTYRRSIMIKNHRQYLISRSRLAKFQNAIREFDEQKSTVHPKLLKAQRDAMISQARDLQIQLDEYKNSRRGDIKSSGPNPSRICPSN